jgi:hypothetical protein
MADVRNARNPDSVRDRTADPPRAAGPATNTDWVDNPATGYNRPRHSRGAGTDIYAPPDRDMGTQSTQTIDTGAAWERSRASSLTGPFAIAATAPSAIALLGGIWLLISRLVYNYASAGSGADGVLNGVVIGIASGLVALALMTTSTSNPVLGLVLAAFGGWMIAAPWVFHYSHWGTGSKGAWSDVVTGGAIALTGVITWMAHTARQVVRGGRRQGVTP